MERIYARVTHVPGVGLDNSVLMSPVDFLARFLGDLDAPVNLKLKEGIPLGECALIAVMEFEALGVVMRLLLRGLRRGEWGMIIVM